MAALRRHREAWSSADGTIDAAKYLQIRQTTSASNDADQTATIDLGDDNVSTWTVRTMKARDIPWVTIDATDAWQTPSGSALGADSQKFTLAMKFNLTAIQSGTNTIFGVSAGSLWFQISLLNSTSGVRVVARNASNVTVAAFDITGLSTGVDYDLLATCDLTQATGADGLVAYLNGAVVSPSNVTFTSGESIHFSGTTTQRFGYLHLQADFGYLYLSNRLVDITSADIRERFSNGRRFGANGENVDGAAPMVLLMGTKAQWEDAGGVNRGTSTPKWIAQSGTGVTPVAGTVTNWPYYAYATTLELTAPADINMGDTAAYVLSADGALANDVSVTLSDDDAGGTFSPESPITLTNADVPSAAFDYTPASTGNKVISASGGGLTDASDVLGVVAPAVSVTYHFTVTIHDASGAAVDINEPLSLTLNP